MVCTMGNKGLLISNGVLTGYSGKEKKIVIDEDITLIAENAFLGNKTLESITISNASLRSIGKKAFYGCKNLKEVSIASLKGKIGESAFEECGKLTQFLVPNGTMEIEKKAFRSCGVPFVLIIPSSVCLIGDAITNIRGCIIVGSNDSEASKYAEKNHIMFRTNRNEVVTNIKTRALIEKYSEIKSFSVFGEDILTSNTLRFFRETLEFYQNEKQRACDLALKAIPTQLNGVAKSPLMEFSNFIQKSVDLVTSRVEKKGVFSPSIAKSFDIIEVQLTILNFLTETVEAHNNIASASYELLSQAADLLVKEAESKVTGLSYGMIGSPLDIVLYGIDDFIERQRQRKAAYNVANAQYSEFSSKAQNAIATKFATVMKESALPTLISLVCKLCDLLQAAEIEILKDNQILIGDIPSLENIAKSGQIIESVRSTFSKDKDYAIALALKLCPFNKAAYAFAAKNDIVSDEILSLASFVGLSDFDLLNEMIANNSISLDGIKAYIQNQCIFGEELSFDCKTVLRERIKSIAKEQSKKQLSLIYTGSNRHEMLDDISKKVNSAFSKGDYDLFEKTGLHCSSLVSEIADEEISRQVLQKQSELASLLESADSISSIVFSLKEYEAVIPTSTINQMLQLILPSQEKKLYQIIHSYSQKQIMPSVEDLKKELEPIVSESDLYYINQHNSTLLGQNVSNTSALCTTMQTLVQRQCEQNNQDEKTYNRACEALKQAKTIEDYQKVEALFSETNYKDAYSKRSQCQACRRQLEIERDYVSALKNTSNAGTQMDCNEVYHSFNCLGYRESPTIAAYAHQIMTLENSISSRRKELTSTNKRDKGSSNKLIILGSIPVIITILLILSAVNLNDAAMMAMEICGPLLLVLSVIGIVLIIVGINKKAKSVPNKEKRVSDKAIKQDIIAQEKKAKEEKERITKMLLHIVKQELNAIGR